MGRDFELKLVRQETHRRSKREKGRQTVILEVPDEAVVLQVIPEVLFSAKAENTADRKLASN